MSQSWGTEPNPSAAIAAMDVSERSRADQERDRLRQTLADLAHIIRSVELFEEGVVSI
jgi:hypothetical protein